MTRRTAKTRPKRRSFTIELEGGLLEKFLSQTKLAGQSPEEHAARLIDNTVAVDHVPDHKRRHAAVRRLAATIKSLPGVHPWLGISTPSDSLWWIKFSIDRKHPLAWHVIQRLAWPINYYSLEHKFPVKFYPVSPPPDLNGGPEFLAWVVEATTGYTDPIPVLKAVRSILPRSIRSAREWRAFDTE